MDFSVSSENQIAPIHYPLSMASWPNSRSIEVYISTGERICILPIASLEASADLNWPFIFYCISTCTTLEPEALRSITLVASESCTAADMKSVPTPGKYVLTFNDSPSLEMPQEIFRRGPIGKRRGRPAASSPATSTQSDSKRSSTNQNKFRWDLVARDSICLITDEPYWDCTASHIVPFSRPDIYEELLGYTGEWLFHPWMGLLLEDKISHAFDRFELSIWPRRCASRYVHEGCNNALHTSDAVQWTVHVFHDRSGRLRAYHGKTFGSERFRLPPVSWPRDDFLIWHHQQCVMMHYRGFSHAVHAARP